MRNRAVLAISLTICLLWASPVAAQQGGPRRGLGRIQGKRVSGNLSGGVRVRGEPQSDAATEYDQMAEDMEIMAHIIYAAVKEAYGSGSLRMSAIHQSESRASEHYIASLVGSPNSDKPSNQKITKPYSAYVKGHGVVFQLEAPPFRQPVKQEESAEADDRPRPSTWERTRMLLQGEVPPDLQSAGCMKCHSSANNLVGRWHRAPADEVHRGAWLDQPTRQLQKGATPAPSVDELADILVRLLSENGRNLRGLAPEEQVTIAVTFRERLQDEATTTTAKSDSPFIQPLFYYDLGLNQLKKLRTLEVDLEGDSKESDAKNKKDDSPLDGKPNQSPPSAASAVSKHLFSPIEIKHFIGPSGKSMALTGLVTVPNEEVEGDLHMRQEDYTKAVESYAKAAKIFLKGDPDAGYDLQSMADSNRPNVARLLRKLCQAHLGLGELEKCSRLLEQLNTLAGGAGDGEKNAENGNKRRALPSRLTISATIERLGAIRTRSVGTVERTKYRDVRSMGGVEFYESSTK